MAYIFLSYSEIKFSIYLGYTPEIFLPLAQSVLAVEYHNCISAEG